MKTCLLLLLTLALSVIPCSAQSTFTPFSWTTIAGSYQLTNVQNGYGGFADGTNGDAQFGAPYSVAVDLQGNVYVGDAANYAIREMTPVGTNWVVTTLAVLPSPASLDGAGFGTLSFNPLGVAVDKNGNVYVADSYYNTIREITPDGTLSTLAGNPFLTNSQGQLGGYLDGPASAALFNYPVAVAVDNAGNLYVADYNNVIRKIYLPPGSTNWQVTTMAGNYAASYGYKDGPGASAQFYGPAGVAVDEAGNVYVADSSNNMIRKITPAGVVTTLAGQNQGYGVLAQGVPYGNADGPGASAQFFYPFGVAVDSATNIYVADTYNSEIRKVTPQGVVTTLGGAPKFGFYGPTDPVGGYQDGASAVARFHTPTGVAVDLDGNIYVADDGNFVIREAVSAPPAITITAMRVGQPQAQVGVSDDIDAPIVPVVDASALAAGAPLGLGVVADGVTPVVFEIVAAPGNYTCQISLNNNATWVPLLNYFFTLQNSQWKNNESFSIATSGVIGTNFAYLNGFEWTNIVTSATEVEAVLTVISPQSGFSNSYPFRIRPPPVALVHGYSANGTSWTQYPSYPQILGMIRPADFIFPISYGSSKGNNTINTTWTLFELLPVLDAALSQQVETPVSAQWAFTRYDVVCHSQGGVLTRMLCQNTWAPRPVVSAQNFFRGRFHRVITIGSPHNGSLLLRYILQLKHAWSPYYFLVNRGLVLKEIAQSKFDPFGWQIPKANDPANPVDARIRFHCIRTTETDGQPPSLHYNPLCYDSLGLCQPQVLLAGQSPGQLLLPKGADGVVDFDSQGAGVGTPGTILLNSPAAPVNIAHADEGWLFGVPSGNSQTSDARVAQVVSGLLTGPASAFGPFVLPSPVSAAEEALIDSLIPFIPPVTLLTHLLPSPLDLSSNFNFQAQLPQGIATGGGFTWSAIVFGTNGVSTNGVTWQQNTNDGSQVTVSVDDGAAGTVVLYSSYAATNGVEVFGNPIVVVIHPLEPVPAGIFLDPSPISLPVGEALPLNIWAQYANGTASLLYLSPGQATYSSSNTNAVTVDSYGTVFQSGFGSSTITVIYAGLSAQTVVSSMPVSIRKLSGAQVPGGFQLSYIGSFGTTNVIETSADLRNWTPLAQFTNTTELVTYVDPAGANGSKRFYRVKIP